MSSLKHKIIIHQVNGRIVHISASGDTDIILIESGVNSHNICKLEPDLQFEAGKAHEMFSDEETCDFLKHHKI
jgi:hypothetical protein